MVKLAERWVQQSGIRYNFLQTSVFTKDGIKTPDSVFFYFIITSFSFIYESKVFTFINLKLGQFKRARPLTASIT